MARKITMKDLPKELQPFAEIVLPALVKMLERDGSGSLMSYLFQYKASNRSWDRKLQRAMTVSERIRWRRIMSSRRIQLLEEVKTMRMAGTALRRAIVRRIMDELILLVVKAL